MQKKGAGWSVRFTIPHSFVAAHQPGFAAGAGQVITGNFFKCGDRTAAPHYGSWSPVELDEANFHRPEFFSAMVFGA